ncbi:putative 26S proteasome regulatory subunit rpn3 [Glarea lozoyensis 74030]|uniref:Putative 26S proteasome regulatory subunit rpn3 n=1 Tax=Glarea lozoyensis (strain ATCC 74030 / MF5533) TaxID=1104152 RepID=H0ETY4_GLAL7|nr:putative 26S proteasome regulatory subunit rpn3 [Glarea lozoyensis 74030]
MPSKTPHTNGNEPVENGVNGTKDVEMKDDAPTSLKGGKGKKSKDGEEEMTVVVPPSKASKLSSSPGKDQEGDVVMEGEEQTAEDDGAVKVDPVTKAVSETYPSTSPAAKSLLVAIDREDATFSKPNTPEMEVDSESKATKSGKKEQKDILPEVDIFLGVLIQIHYLDKKDNNRASPVVSLRPALLSALRTAVLRKDVDTQSTVIAVRVGLLGEFESTIKQHSEAFRRDGTYTLILRLRQNVIKTGIRMMSLSYSRISLRDICIRLKLESEESAEYIVAKAIRDGVIEASLDRERGFMKSKEVGDVYATREPGEAFHERIQACLSLHDESVKAMRFPMNQHRLELKNAQEAREREREMAKEIQDGDLDEDDLGGEFEGM